MRCMKCQQDKDQQFSGQRICKQCASDNERVRQPKATKYAMKKQTKPKRDSNGSQH